MKVRVILRVSPGLGDESDNHIVTLDKRKNSVIVEDKNSTVHDSRVGVAAPKIFSFDHVFSKTEPQVSHYC